MTHTAPSPPPADSARPTRRRSRIWLGVALLVTGLTLLGYVGWQFVGTNIVSERRQTALVDELETQWTSPGTALDQDGETGTSEATALIRIPRFGGDYVMPILEGVDDDALSGGFGHFEQTAGPGEVGNFALAGHRVTHGEPLRDMPSLEPGDTVVVETSDAVYTYVVDSDPEDLVIDFDQTWVLDAAPRNPSPDGVQPDDDPRLITLMTCASLFHTDDRMVVFGHLIEAHPK